MQNSLNMLSLGDHLLRTAVTLFLLRKACWLLQHAINCNIEYLQQIIL